MTVVRLKPFGSRLREFDELFSRLAPTGTEVSVRKTEWQPLVDILESDDGFGIEMELPGFAREDVKVSVHEGRLSVSGERAVERDDDAERKRHRTERWAGKFERSFQLPDNVDETAIKATARDGVLYIALPKRAEEKPRAIEVEVH